MASRRSVVVPNVERHRSTPEAESDSPPPSTTRGTAPAPRAASSSEAKCASGGSARSLRARGLGPDLIDLARGAPRRRGSTPTRIVDVDQRLARPVGQVVEHRGRARRGRTRAAAPPSRSAGMPSRMRSSRLAELGWWAGRSARRRRGRRPRRRARVVGEEHLAGGDERRLLERARRCAGSPGRTRGATPRCPRRARARIGRL